MAVAVPGDSLILIDGGFGSEFTRNFQNEIKTDRREGNEKICEKIFQAKLTFSDMMVMLGSKSVNLIRLPIYKSYQIMSGNCRARLLQLMLVSLPKEGKRLEVRLSLL